jgi:hypothetical protein
MAFHGSCQPLKTSEEANGVHKKAYRWYIRYQAMVYGDLYRTRDQGFTGVYAVPGTLQPVQTCVTGTYTMPGRTGQERPSG